MIDTDWIETTFRALHAMPEVGFQEKRTSAFVAEMLGQLGFEVATGIAGTGVVGTLKGKHSGPAVGVRADMDALSHTVAGELRNIHSCGHDAHMTMALGLAKVAASRKVEKGTLKLIFQPGEETLFGARKMIEHGVIDDIDHLLGIHLRPAQEASLGQATPALYHGSSYHLEATLTGVSAHGARPHLGVNVIDAAAAVVNAINAIRIDPTVPHSAKVTRLIAGGGANNIIPDKAELALDLRCQSNPLMRELIDKVTRAIETAASTVGAEASVAIKGGVVAAEYSDDMINLAREAIVAVLGEQGLLAPIVTPGADDFHFYAQHKPALKAGFVGLGSSLLPGLHHPEMSFDHAAMQDGIGILSHMVERLVGYETPPA